MSQTSGATVLVVANRTSSTPALLAEVHRRAATCRFGLMVPPDHHLWHRHGLTDRVQELGVPVTVIPPEMDGWGPVAGFPGEWTPKAVSPASVAGFGNY